MDDPFHCPWRQHLIGPSLQQFLCPSHHRLATLHSALHSPLSPLHPPSPTYYCKSYTKFTNPPPPFLPAYNSLQYKTLRPTFPHPGDPSTNHFGYNGTTGCTAHFPDRAHFSDSTRCISLDFTSYNHSPSLPRCPIFFSTF